MKRLLDLYCKAGGSTKGYQRAGFHVTGVDSAPQPRHCGDEFIQADALEYLEAHGHEYDAIHASPPCQGYSIMHNLPWMRGREYPRLIKPTRDLLNRVGKPWVLENVMGARWGCKNLKNISEQLGYDITEHGMKASYLCGTMFGLPFYRHRLFETDWMWMAPSHSPHGGGTRGSVGPTDPQKGRGVSEQIVAIPTRAGNFDPNYREKHPKPVNTECRRYHDGALNIRPGYEKVPFAVPTIIQGSLSTWQHHPEVVGVGHAAGWKLAAEAMGIDWMKREELTQAIPPVYTEHIGAQLMRYLK